MEYLIQKVGMSRTVSVPSVPITLVKIKTTKVCELLENSRAIVAFNSGKKINKALQGKQKKYNISKEFNTFRTIKVANKEIGDISLTPIVESKRVKVSLNTKGRGFSGVIKRWNFSGGPKSHGSRFHRRGGSIGNCEWPGRVMRGKKMSGQYGNTKVTVQSDVISFDSKSKVIVLKGSIPGHNNALGKIEIMK